MSEEPSSYEAYLEYLYETFVVESIRPSRYRRFPDSRS